MPLRDAFGHLIRRAEAAPAAAPMPADPAGELRQAEAALAAHAVESAELRRALNDAAACRAELAAAGDIAGAVAAKADIDRIEVAFEALALRGQELDGALRRAQHECARARWAAVQPELDRSRAALCAAAYDLACRLDALRAVQARAGVLVEPDLIAINAHLMTQWIFEHQQRRGERVTGRPAQPQAA